jgi:hypothetical protein
MLTNRFFPFSLIIFLFTSFQSYSQCSFTASDNSYRVDVKVHVISLSVSATGGDCTFNYAVVQYDIDFVSLNGTPPPSSMYTLQGNVTCNGRSMFFDLPNEGGPYISGQPNAWATTNSATAGGNPFNSSGNCSSYNVSYCNQIRITIEGVNIPSQTVLCTSTPTPLATRLKSFDLSSSDDRTVKLDWSTTNEKNSSHYVLEHSEGNGTFETIAEISSKGGSK